jgi:hypothetical protein
MLQAILMTVFAFRSDILRAIQRNVNPSHEVVNWTQSTTVQTGEKNVQTNKLAFGRTIERLQHHLPFRNGDRLLQLAVCQ